MHNITDISIDKPCLSTLTDRNDNKTHLLTRNNVKVYDDKRFLEMIVMNTNSMFMLELSLVTST